ncbi:hypothetical protein CHS0354_024009 [Potamilus streckersoni]|uniref:Fibronectin type-III domain-containing protein n=1 Tax=Potamilus streckersoni TaxID=2493646 RepID=A0AAE0RZD5_9BIVA|nr:hypothetical protein CHS0354_024009 [Potamilus streckersoni]
MDIVNKEHQIEVLHDIEPKVLQLMSQHDVKRELWFSSDVMPTSDTPETEEYVKQLRSRAQHLPENVKVSIALNLITEEGLPHFHRLIAQAFDNESAWKKWNNLWTAEEDRHGNILRDYCRESRVFDFNELEKLQFDYILKGFTPRWGGNPYKTLVYTSAQERATQVSHESTSRAAKEIEPVIAGIMKRISVEEARHHFFYMSIYKEILIRDANEGLQCAFDVLSRFEMPGTSMNNFADIAEVVMKSEIYTLEDYKIILDQLLAYWKVEAMTGLNEMGRKAQEKIMELPKRTAKIAEYIKSKIGTKSFSFDFLTRTENREQRTENREQRTENREQRTENREQRTENREQRTENREQRTENREQRTENREQRTENREQRTENREQRTENRGRANLLRLLTLLFFSLSLFSGGCPEPTPTKFTITIDANGGILGSVTTIEVDNGGTATLPTIGLPTRTRYTISGWKIKDGSPFIFGTTKVTANITIVAQWVEVFIITLNANGGTLGSVKSIEVESGKTATLPTTGLPTRLDHTLSGWNTKADGRGTAFKFGETTVTANIEIFVQWVAIIPGAITGLTATALAEQVTLSWTAANNATYYNVYRDGTKINTSNITETTYTDNTVAVNTMYSYTVKAFNSVTSSAEASVSVTTKIILEMEIIHRGPREVVVKVTANKTLASVGFAVATSTEQKPLKSNLDGTTKSSWGYITRKFTPGQSRNVYLGFTHKLTTTPATAGSTTNINETNTSTTEYTAATWMIIPGREYKVLAYYNNGKADRIDSVKFTAVAWPTNASSITDFVQIGSTKYVYLSTLKNLTLDYKVGEPLLTFGRLTIGISDSWNLQRNDLYFGRCNLPMFPCDNVDYAYAVGNGNGIGTYPAEYLFLHKTLSDWRIISIYYESNRDGQATLFYLREVSE